MVPRTNIQKTFNKRKKAWQIQGTSAPFSYIVTEKHNYKQIINKLKRKMETSTLSLYEEDWENRKGGIVFRVSMC
jgi:predicted  nucleic acid-binding Zn-ribbon protein